MADAKSASFASRTGSIDTGVAAIFTVGKTMEDAVAAAKLGVAATEGEAALEAARGREETDDFLAEQKLSDPGTTREL
jgi:hypothetical protein